MSFHEVRFPENISYGSLGGPGFQTSVLTSGTGKEQRVGKWSRSRAEYDAKYAIRSESDMFEVIKFFYARRGKLFGFRYKDWSDYKIENQNVAVLRDSGDSNEYQLFKRYEDDGGSYDRTITKTVDGSATEFQRNGNPIPDDDWEVDPTTGIFTFNGAYGAGSFASEGDIISVTYIEFDVPARFDIDELPVSIDGFDEQSVQSIPIVEIQT